LSFFRYCEYAGVCIIKITALNCGDPQSNLSTSYIAFQSGSTINNFLYNIFAQIVCQNGYRWNDGANNKTIICTSTGSWTVAESCIGM